jgi:hypothetical protein
MDEPNPFCSNRSEAGDACGWCEGCVAESERIARLPLEGRRVRLLRFGGDPYTTMHPGAEGVITHVDDLGTVHVHWDDGRSLGLVADGGDRWEVL